MAQQETYWIKLANESLFEDRAVVETLADLIIAAYDLRLAARAL